MPQVDLVDVRIMVDDQPLQEYPCPDDEAAAEDGATVHFVEAVPGQRFRVKVTWLAGFRTSQAPYLRCELQLDENKRRQVLRCNDLQVQEGILTQEAYVEFGTSKYKDDQGQWKQCFYSFGPLGLGKILLKELK